MDVNRDVESQANSILFVPHLTAHNSIGCSPPYEFCDLDILEESISINGILNIVSLKQCGEGSKS